MTPVYARQPDGTYAPHNLFWPAFWTYERNDTLYPVSPGVVGVLVREIFRKDTMRSVGRWPSLRRADVVGILQTLQRWDSSGGTPAYVSAGQLFVVGENDSLEAHRHEAAAPYGWPLAHDVRPKAQSLGIRGCDDCHATDSPFYFGSVHVASPFLPQSDSLQRMTEYQDRTAIFPWLFSMSFLFRPGLKLVVVLSSIIIAAVVLIYLVRGFAQLVRTLAAEEE
jgi:hypothetical protein